MSLKWIRRGGVLMQCGISWCEARGVELMRRDGGNNVTGRDEGKKCGPMRGKPASLVPLFVCEYVADRVEPPVKE